MNKVTQPAYWNEMQSTLIKGQKRKSSACF